MCQTCEDGTQKISIVKTKEVTQMEIKATPGNIVFLTLSFLIKLLNEVISYKKPGFRYAMKQTILHLALSDFDMSKGMGEYLNYFAKIQIEEIQRKMKEIKADKKE